MIKHQPFFPKLEENIKYLGWHVLDEMKVEIKFSSDCCKH